MEQFLCLLLHFIKRKVLDSRKDTQLSKFNLKKNKKASKIVHSYVLTQMFLSLKCCRKEKSKITVSSLTVTFLTRKRAFLLQNRINESLRTEHKSSLQK